MEAGCPTVDAKALAGFDAWSKIVRYPLIWLGCPDIVDTMEQARQDDPVREGLRIRKDALVDIFGTEDKFTAGDVYKKGMEQKQTGSANSYQPVFRYPELRAGFFDTERNPSSRTIGTQLGKDMKRISDGYHIDRVKDDAVHGHLYQMFGPARSPKEET